MDSGEEKDAEISSLQQQVQQLQTLKEQMEREFGEGRAKLKQLYMQKEEEVRVLGVELEEANSRVVIAECTAENRVEAEQRKCREELATMQQLAREELADVQDRYEAELQQLKHLSGKQDSDRRKLRHLYQQAKEQLEHQQQLLQQHQQATPSTPASILSPGVLSGLTKSIIAKHVPGLATSHAGTAAPHSTAVAPPTLAGAPPTSGSPATSGAPPTPALAPPTAQSTPVAPVAQLVSVTSEGAGFDNPAFSDSSERSIMDEGVPRDKWSDVDGAVLQGVVLSLQQEVLTLREQLRQATGGAAAAAAGGGDAAPASTTEESSLAAEKSSRADLELYTSILNVQRSDLHRQVEELRVEGERQRQLHISSHQQLQELRATWRRANDQFLNSQRHALALERRLRGVLTPSQLEALHRDAEEDEDVDVDGPLSPSDGEDDLLDSPRQHDGGGDSCQQLVAATTTAVEEDQVAAAGVQDPLEEEDGDSEDNILEEIDLPLKGSAVAAQSPSSSPAAGVSPSHHHPGTGLETPDSLPDARLLSPDAPAAPSVDAALLRPGQDVLPLPPGGPLPEVPVSAASWRRLQRSLRQTRAALALPCQGCAKYREQVQQMRSDLELVSSSKVMVEKALERQLAELEREADYRASMEEQFQQQLEQFQQQEVAWTQRSEDAARLHRELQARWKGVVTGLHQQLSALTADRQRLHRHLNRVQLENDTLAGKHLKTARQLQEETIDLPTTLEEMQLLLLRLKEEVITAKVSKESTEENLSSTVALLQSQLLQEEEGGRRRDEALQRENRELRDMVGSLQQSAAQDQHSEETLQQQQQQELILLQAVKKELGEAVKAKHALEAEVAEQRQRVSSLQHDLDLSEETQRDFVRLSQSLQVQLEKIRQSDSEVRWQHEDDVDECNNCRQRFTPTRRKHHCRHCGHLFCSDCASQTVPGGPRQRPCRVCSVCHTLLVPHATPYFSASPHTTQ